MHRRSGYIGEDGGWSSYFRGTDNTLQLRLPHLIVNTIVCLSQVTLTLSWQVVPHAATAISFAPTMGPLTGFTSVSVLGFNFDPARNYMW